MEKHKPQPKEKPREDKSGTLFDFSTLQEDFSPYNLPDYTRSCDKPDHAQRSLANDPTHTKHWGKNPPK